MEHEKLQISTESVRQLMIAEGLWKARPVRKRVAHQLRERRACFGELIQIDGSPHDWFEGRAAPCTLLVFSDDATGKLLYLQFVNNESFFSYGQACAQYFQSHGKPVAFYSDKHGIFRVNQRSVGSSDALTQFGPAMQELDVQIICANTPQAKGRVERVILTWQEQRIVSKNLTVQFDKVVYQIQTDRPGYALRKASITVCRDAQNKVTLLYKGQALSYNVFHQQVRQSEVVLSKDLNRSIPRQPAKPAPDHPWRNYAQSKNRRSAPALPTGDTSTLENK